MTDVLEDWKVQWKANARESHSNVKPDIAGRRLRSNAQRTRGVERAEE